MQGQMERAARLFGVTERLRTLVGAAPSPALQAVYDGAVALTRRALGDSAFDAAHAEGRALSLDAAVALAQTAGRDADAGRDG